MFWARYTFYNKTIVVTDVEEQNEPCSLVLLLHDFSCTTVINRTSAKSPRAQRVHFHARVRLIRWCTRKHVSFSMGPESRKTVIYSGHWFHSSPDHGYFLLNWANRGKIPAFMNWLPKTVFYYVVLSEGTKGHHDRNTQAG